MMVEREPLSSCYTFVNCLKILCVIFPTFFHSFCNEIMAK